MLEIDANSDYYYKWAIIGRITDLCHNLVEECCFGGDFEIETDACDYLFGYLC